jgi:hypothetical protein
MNIGHSNFESSEIVSRRRGTRGSAALMACHVGLRQRLARVQLDTPGTLPLCSPLAIPVPNEVSRVRNGHD